MKHDMTAIGFDAADGEGVGNLDRDLVVKLIVEASTSFETDRYKAKCCLQRAVELVRGKQASGSQSLEAPAVPGGLATWQVKKVTGYVESNIGAQIPVAALADLVGLSTGHFFRAFRTSFGMTPRTYIMRRRISRAEMLMATSSEPLVSIALDCGFNDHAHLSKAFRRLVGVSPSIWRQQFAFDRRSAAVLSGHHCASEPCDCVAIMQGQARERRSY